MAENRTVGTGRAGHDAGRTTRPTRTTGMAGASSVAGTRAVGADGGDRGERELARCWDDDPRWAGVSRTYTAHDVVRLRGSVVEEHTLARLGAEKLWRSLHESDYVQALGALTGNQAVQQVRAGLRAIYLSGWQVAADANLAG